MAYTLNELEALLLAGESDFIERKESFRGDTPKAVREAVCGFMNDLPGNGHCGVVFVGVRDDGTPAGLSITDDLLRQLADIKTDGNIVPPPTLTVSKQTLRGAEIAVIMVWPTDSPPARCYGRICIRIGPRRGIASAQDERILNERRRHRDRPFDARHVPGATLSDLDRQYFENEYLGAAFATDVLAANDRSYEQRLAATKMVSSTDDPTPTVLGVLVLSSRSRDFLPGAYIQFLRIDGRELADAIIDEQLLDGSVATVLRRMDEKLASHNRVSVDIVSSARERRRSLYPMAALQQFVRNAVLHRSYEDTNAPVRVTWYSDRIEITNPGGPYGAVTPENFGAPGITDYRNPNLAEALRVLGFVQRFGVGIATARRELESNGNPPPKFEVNASNVGVTLEPAA